MLLCPICVPCCQWIRLYGRALWQTKYPSGPTLLLEFVVISERVVVSTPFSRKPQREGEKEGKERGGNVRGRSGEGKGGKREG